MRSVRLRWRARHRGARVGDQPLDQRGRARRRGDELARACAEAQAELQHVEGILGAPPFRQLVAPGGVELRPAQALRIFGRERLRDRAVAPFEALARRRPDRPLAPRPRAHQPRRALDHHLAYVVIGFADQRDVAVRRVRVRRQAQRERAHELGAEPRLAGAAPAERQPRGPWTAVVGESRRELMLVGERREVMVEALPAPGLDCRQCIRRPAGSRQMPQCVAQDRDGSHRCR